MGNSPSPFSRPDPGIRIKEGAPAFLRVGRHEAATLAEKARALIRATRETQERLVRQQNADLSWMEGRHFLLAGATGTGLGGALATAVFDAVVSSGSLTIVARDLSRSLGYETGLAMQARAEETGMGTRFHWFNNGLALEGKSLDMIVEGLREAGADRIIYINTVAFAYSGLLPGLPPVFVKDVDDEGLFQWQLTPLSEQAITATKFYMGTLAVEFIDVLEGMGIEVEAAVFADWRGSLDRISRDPSRIEYGRQGAYSTSLYLPKEIIQEKTISAFRSGRIVMDCFLPIMRTQALSFVPGGLAMSCIYEKLMEKESVRRIEVPELALSVLDRVRKALRGDDVNPFPRLDCHEAQLDLWFYEILTRLNNDEDSEFYFKHMV